MTKTRRILIALAALGLVAVPAAAQCDDFTFDVSGDAGPGGTVSFASTGATPGAFILTWASDRTGAAHNLGPIELCLGQAAAPVNFGTVGQNGGSSWSIQLPSQLPNQLNGLTLHFQATTLEISRPPAHPGVTSASSNTDSITIHVP
jgi:hypothetical protein